jgi:hypothetical protein
MEEQVAMHPPKWRKFRNNTQVIPHISTYVSDYRHDYSMVRNKEGLGE